MENILTTTFNNLSKKELKRFRKYVYSPYFNGFETIQKLFNYLESKHPKVTKEHLNRYDVSVYVYRQKRVNHTKVRKLISDFGKIFLHFLRQIELEFDGLTNDIAQLRASQKRRMYDHYEKHLAKMKFTRQHKLALTFSRDHQDYLEDLTINNEEYSYGMEDPKCNHRKLIADSSDVLDMFFAYSKLHIFYDRLILEYETGKLFKSEFNFIKEIYLLVHNNKERVKFQHPNLYVIYLTCRMYTDPGNSYHEILAEYLQLNEKRFPKSKLSYYYRYLSSFYISKVNEGDINYRSNAFDAYKKLVNKNIFVIDNYLNEFEFNNVVNMGLPLGHHDWTGKFIEKHKKFLKKQDTYCSYNLSKAKYHFYKKEFDEVMPYLDGRKHNGPGYFVNSKFLASRTLFELGDYQECLSVLGLIDQYVKRNKDTLNKQMSRMSVTTIKYFRALLKLQATKTKFNKQLLKELENEKGLVSGKEWIVEKVRGV